MVRLRALGGLAVEHAALDDGAAHRRPLAVLALLAVAGDRGMTRDKIAAFLWPESDDERARNSLSRALSSLRRELGVEQLVLGSTELRLNPASVTSDVQEFSRLLADGDAERAVTLYAGPFLDGVFIKGAPEFERWADQERRRLHRLRADALESLAVRSRSIGDHDGAVRWWRQRSDADPLDARVTRSLMEAHVAAADSPAAIRHFHAHEALLREELDVAPEPMLAAFAKNLSSRSPVRPTASAIAPDGKPDASHRAPIEAPAPRRRFAVKPLTMGSLVLALGAGTILAMRFNGADHDLVVGSVSRITSATDTLSMDAAISPDGNAVAYAAGTPGQVRVFVRSLGSASGVMISGGLRGDHRWPRWSPDNSTIAFTVTSPGGRTSAYRIPREGGQPQLVAERGIVAAWAPSGNELLVSYGDSSWVVPSAGGASHRFPVRTGPHAAWSPNHRWVAFASGLTGSYLGISGAGIYGSVTPSAIRIADADGNNAHAITDSTHLAASPAWSPDGQSVFFVSDRDGVRDVYRQRIGPDGQATDPLERVTIGADVWSFTLSADGSRMAYSTLQSHLNIWMAPLANGMTPFSEAHQVTNIKQRVESFALSHDGRWIAFQSHRDGTSHIYKIAFDGHGAVGAPIQLTRDSISDHAPRWSPDDREIAFHRGTVLGKARVFIVRADGLGERRLTSDSTAGVEVEPDWSPDGERLTYLTPKRAGNALIMDASVVTRLADGSWSAPRPINDRRDRVGYELRWSPTGTRLASDCCLWSPNGGEKQSYINERAFDGQGSRWFEWGDEHTLFFYSRDSSRVASFWRLVLPDRRPHRVLRMTDPTKPAPITRFDTDGRSLFFLIAASEGDVFVATLKRR